MTSAVPFRSQYLTFAEVESQLHAWAASHADVCKLHVIGHSLEGRPLYVLAIGDEQAPAVWIDANMHATEVSGRTSRLASRRRSSRCAAGRARRRLAWPKPWPRAFAP